MSSLKVRTVVLFTLLATGVLSQRDITVLQNVILPDEPYEEGCLCGLFCHIVFKFFKVLCTHLINALQYQLLPIYIIHSSKENWWCQTAQHKCAQG